MDCRELTYPDADFDVVWCWRLLPLREGEGGLVVTPDNPTSPPPPQALSVGSLGCGVGCESGVLLVGRISRGGGDPAETTWCGGREGESGSMPTSPAR